LDEDFVFFRTFDLYIEYEEMDIQHRIFTELSKSAETTQDEIDALWDMFRARINNCREIRREIRSAGGFPALIPEWFLT
jgi:RNAse (barnase) inhibitor barstar